MDKDLASVASVLWADVVWIQLESSGEILMCMSFGFCDLIWNFIYFPAFSFSS